MCTVELITALFFEVDEQLRAIPTHPEAHLWPNARLRKMTSTPARRHSSTRNT